MLAALLLALGVLLGPQPPQLSGPAGLEGHVIDEEKAPVEGARVFATSVEGGPRIEVVTDRRGRFLFSSVPVGRYRIQAEKLGYVVNPLTAGVVTTLTKPVGGLVLTLYKAGIITGQVYDQGGNPVPRVIVQALRKTSATGSAGSQGPPPLTDDRGEFRVMVMAGEYVVMAQPARRVPGSSLDVAMLPTYFPSTTTADHATAVTVRPGQTSCCVNILMQTGRAYQISGLVTDEQGSPQPGALVTLVRQVLAGQMSLQASAVGSPARADGSFTMTGIPPGTYRLISLPIPITPVQGDSIPTRAIAGVTAALSGQTPSTIVEVRDADVKDVRVVVPALRKE
jgi:hypothetical protein